MTTNQQYHLGIVGVRGYVGQALLQLIDQHPHIDVAWISSRQLQGQPAAVIFADHHRAAPLSAGLAELIIDDLAPQQVAAKHTDIVVLALPNGLAAQYVAALNQAAEQQPTEQQSGKRLQVIIDLSADYRFDNDWLYSVPELDGLAAKISDMLLPSQIKKLANQITEAAPPAIKISNPGCYATAMQLALAPIKDLIEGPAHCFGVSGYSGAGTTPSPANDPDNLRDNLWPYKLVEHLHEKEVTERLTQQIFFSPHVAEFFAGINITSQVALKDPCSVADIIDRFATFYANDPLVICQTAIPNLKQVVDTPNCLIGGFSLSQDGKRLSLVSCLDNLQKGAASQALQNINIALGFESTLGLNHIGQLNPIGASS